MSQTNNRREREKERARQSLASQAHLLAGQQAFGSAALLETAAERSVSTKKCLSRPPASCAAPSAGGSSSASRPAAAVCTAPGPGAAAAGPAAVAGLPTSSYSPAADAGTLFSEWTPPAGSLWSYGYRTEMVARHIVSDGQE